MRSGAGQGSPHRGRAATLAEGCPRRNLWRYRPHPGPAPPRRAATWTRRRRRRRRGRSRRRLRRSRSKRRRPRTAPRTSGPTQARCALSGRGAAGRLGRARAGVDGSLAAGRPAAPGRTDPCSAPTKPKHACPCVRILLPRAHACAESYDYVFEDQIEFIVDQYLAGSAPVRFLVPDCLGCAGLDAPVAV